MPICRDDGLFRHPRTWTLAEVLAMPEDQGERIELVDGVLLMSPAPVNDHQDIVLAVADALRVDIPAEWKVLLGPNVVLGADRLLIPDLAVVAREKTRGRKACDAGDVLITVEVVSPSSRQFDYLNKRRMYADARIPHYLVIDPTKPGIAIESHLLDGDAYSLSRRSDNGLLKLAEPYPIALDIDLDAL